VGGNRLIDVDVRLVAATHRSLDRLVQEGKFRDDLYFRIRVVQIQIPPLRDRPEDIPILAESFRKEYSLENGKGDLFFAPASMRLMMNYRWPGNVRELRTAVEHGVVLAKGKTIEPEDLPNSVRARSEGILSRVDETNLRLDKIQKSLIDVAMDKTGKNISKAAQALGISRRTLHRKLAQSPKKGKIPR
jgi:DNA-binding NtrC family response regulator